MTDFAINEQLSAIKKATDNALKSKEAALKFLQDAGIVRDKSNQTAPQNTSITVVKTTVKKG